MAERKSVKGRKVYNNGIESRMFSDGEVIPEGWVPGLVPRSKKAIEESNKKRKETNLKKYGTESPMQSAEVQERARQACLEHYEVDNPSLASEVQAARVQTFRKRYGVDNPAQIEGVQEKIKQTCLETYGVENPFQSEEIKERIKQANLENLGVEYPTQSKDVLEKRKKAYIEQYGVDNPLRSDKIKEKISKTCQELYGVPWSCMRPEARAYSNDSGPNKAFADLLDSLNISYEREYHIGSYSYDFRINNILIEINPFATHNSLWGIFDNDGKSYNYHFNKSHIAINNGFRCIHIFDWDDIDKILSLLAPRKRIYARKCTLKEVPVKECNSFLLWNHLQGMCKGQDICLGLYYQDELVSVMTFGRPRYNKNYQYELLRYCSSYNIIGGAEKLFSHFVKDYQPESIISYCNRAKFLGKVYPKLGFQLKSSGQPSKHWYNPKTGQHFTDNLVRQRGVDQLLGTSYGKGTSNEELLIQHDFVPIYDCGQDSYIWEKS